MEKMIKKKRSATSQQVEGDDPAPPRLLEGQDAASAYERFHFLSEHHLAASETAKRVRPGQAYDLFLKL